jgi:RNA polymerase sigma-70 factor (ECF subfamily)
LPKLLKHFSKPEATTAYPALEDSKLIILVAQLDSSAFDVLYDRHSGPVYSLVWHVLPNQTLCDDVCQETFLSLWRKAGSYQAHKGTVRNWLLAMGHNSAIDHLRKANRHREDWNDEAETTVADLNAEDMPLNNLTAQELHKTVSTLPLLQQQVVELSFYSGYTHQEIAGLLDIPLGTVKSRMNLALNKLRGSLERNGLTNELLI